MIKLSELARSLAGQGLIRAGLLAALGLAVLAHCDVALAQAIERNPPPATRTVPPTIVEPNVVPAQEDARPIGPSLRAIKVLGPQDAVSKGLTAGVDTAAVTRLNTARGRAVLARFIGRPISRRLIAEIEAAIARYYRKRNYPFVSLSTPEQEITGGDLQIRVAEFHAGRIEATGAKRTPPAYIRDRVRLRSGEPIKIGRLTQDLQWLNRYPFRQVQAVFSPGQAPREADLDLQTREEKRWRVYAGYSNSGSPDLAWDRFFVGAMIGDLPTRDAVLAYQLTASPDFWTSHGASSGANGHPRYVSHAAQLRLPTASLQQFELAFDRVETNRTVGPFAERQIATEGSLGYRFALANVIAAPGDLFAGLEASGQQRTISFGGVPVLAPQIEVYQLFVGWSDLWADKSGRTSVDVTAHVSPGGLTAGNGAAAFAAYTSGRVRHTDYAYLNATISHEARLAHAWGLASTAYVQIADHPLPESQEIGLGGQQLVRGYSLDDGGFDTGVVWRNELRAPSFSFIHRGRWGDEVSPFAFLDASYGKRLGAGGQSAHPISAGLGADYRLGPVVSANLAGVYAITDAPVTKAGDWRLEARVVLTY